MVQGKNAKWTFVMDSQKAYARGTKNYFKEDDMRSVAERCSELGRHAALLCWAAYARFVVATILLASIAAALGCATSALSARSGSARAVIEAKFAAVNRHDIAEVVRLYAPNAQVTASNFCAPRHGRADVQRTYQSIFERYPDVVADVHEYFVQGDRVAVRFTVRSQLPGKSVDVPIANFFTVRNGLIESDDGVFDTGGRPCLP
jgi:ketosteroid isomerase-like protein